MTSSFLHLITLRITASILAIVISCASGLSLAATQGNLGTSSNATVDINIVLENLVRIFGFNDIDLGVWSGSGDLSQSDGICVFVNGRNGQTINYNLLVAGDGTATDLNAFSLTNGVDQLTYRVFLTDDFGKRSEITGGLISSGHQFQMDGPLRSAFSAGKCSGKSEDASIEVLVEESELSTASVGVYTGTLTLTLIPE